MSSGHAVQSDFDPQRDMLHAFLRSPFPKQPGSHFLYDVQVSHALSCAFHKAARENVWDYLEKKLFPALGISNYHWEKDNAGVNIGGFGLYLTTLSIAKLGQLLLRKGDWEGNRLVPQE